MNSPTKLVAFSGFLMAIAIALGAFGAHALKEVLSAERLETWQTAVQYQVWNSLGILVMILIGKEFSVDVKASALFVLVGIFIFSGSLYLLCLTGINWLGAITPIGGILFITGWVFFGLKFISIPKRKAIE